MGSNTTQRQLPGPPILADSALFWEHTKNGRLMAPRCTRCEQFHWYPRAHCPHCFHDKVDWQLLLGTGTIYSYSVTRAAATPYAIAYVALPEGITMLSNIVDCDLDDIHIGQRVRAVFVTADNGCQVPVFTPSNE
jgi:uncharacterized OB-fold protein